MQEPVISGYTVLKEEGSGTFGTVYRARWNNQWDCAVKVLEQAAVNAAYVSWCSEKLSSGETHPNVAAIYGYDLAHQPAYTTCAWIPRVGQGFHDLDEASSKWSLFESVNALNVLASALAWLHHKGIIHTGLTPRNVLLIDGSPQGVCVTDVGQGMVDAGQTADWLAHAPYFSPERCRGEAPQGESSGEAWDVYAFGVLAFKLITGRLPRADEFFKTAEKQRAKKKGAPPSPSSAIDLAALAKRLENEAVVSWGSRAGSSEELSIRKIVDKCLALNPTHRYAHMNEVQAELEQVTLMIPAAEPVAAPAVSPAPAPAPAPAPVLVTTKGSGSTPQTVRANRKGKGGKGAKNRAAAMAAASVSPAPVAVATAPAAVAKTLAAAVPAAEVHHPSIPSPGAHSISIPADHDPVKTLKAVKIKPEALPNSVSPATRGSKWTTLGLSAAAVIAIVAAGVQTKKKAALEATVASMEEQVAKAQTLASASVDQANAQEKRAQSAIAEQARLKLNLQQEQDTSNNLLAALVEQKPADDQQIGVWEDRLRTYAEQARLRLETIGKDPALKEIAARTRWNMAEINLALGEKENAATWLDGALRDVDAAAAATTDKNQRAEWEFLSGKILARRGDLALSLGKSAEASQHLSQASKAIEGFLAGNPDDPVALREYARATWLQGKALLAKADGAGAAEVLAKSTDAAGRLIYLPAQRDEDVFQFVDSYQAMARAHALTKDFETALKDLLQPLEKLRLFERDHPKSNPARERLAASYVEMGRMLMRQKDDQASAAAQSLTQGINVLLELVLEHPEIERYNLQVGTAYGDVARLVRDVKQKSDDALPYAQRAVAYLSILVQKNRVVPEYRLRYAQELATLANLYEDTSKFEDSLKSATEAFALLDELAADTALPGEEQAEVQSSLATVQQALGYSSQKLNKKEDAISWYAKTVDAWKKVAAANPKDDKAVKNLTWTQDQLKSLRPGS